MTAGASIVRSIRPVLIGLAAAILLVAVPGTARGASTNGRIAFASDRGAGDLDIYSMNADGTGQTQLTNAAGDDTYPVWSPTGAQILFTSARNGSFDIFRMQASGGSVTQMTAGPDSDIEPTWSPDASRIAFVSDRSGSLQIHRSNSNGTGSVEQLTFTSGFNVDPVWSANGKIVFTSSRDGNEEIYVMNADGSNPTRLTNDPARDYGPYWSPDGSRIAFQSERDGNSEIYAMDPNGAALTRLTNDPAVDSSPAWSPDGSKIAFHTNRDGQFEIYATDPDGSATARLTNNPALDKFPDWQPVAAGGVDTDPPTLTLPPDMTVDATSPAGATVSYSVTAVDAVDPSPVVRCSPAAGSTFPIGVTPVRCTATDRAGNVGGGSFSVKVRNATEQLARLVQAVATGLRLPPRLEQRLVAYAMDFKPPTTPLQRQFVCLRLTQFELAIKYLPPQIIPTAERDAWVAAVDRIRAVLPC